VSTSGKTLEEITAEEYGNGRSGATAANLKTAK
jgi:hypothetical protein